MIFTIKSPISVPVSKNKELALNLNVYRNTHYRTLNNAKRVYEDLMHDALVNIPPLISIQVLQYTLYPRTRRRIDVSNVCSIVDKFFSDTLVRYGVIEDDNSNYIQCVQYQFGCVDPKEPRVEILIDGLPRERIR